MIDGNGYKDIEEWALKTQKAVDQERWKEATRLWGYTEGVIISVAGNIDFYNILEKKHPQGLVGRSLPGPSLMEDRDLMLSRLMNNNVKKTLGLNSTWGVQGSQVFQELKEDFMKPVINIGIFIFTPIFIAFFVLFHF